jgi:hypothetical protein
MYNWKEEFGEDYDIPQEIEEKYDDQSWHNDSSPSFLILQEGLPEVETDKDGSVRFVKSEDGDHYRLCLWVEHPEKDMRELPLKRFEIVMHGDNIDGFCLAASEEFDEEFQTKLRIIETYAKAHGLDHIAKHEGISVEAPVCSCGNRNMASMGIDIICDVCHAYCGEVH